jgi:superoxide dismutase
LKELKGDIGDLRGGVEAVQQGQVVHKSFWRWLSNRVTAVTEENHADMENLFGSIDALSSDLRGLQQGSQDRREQTRLSHFYGSEWEPIQDPDTYD